MSWQISAISTVLRQEPSVNDFGCYNWGVVLHNGKFVSVLYESDFEDSVEVQDKSRSLNIEHDHNGIGYIDICYLHKHLGDA